MNNREITARDRVKAYWTTDSNYLGYGECLSFEDFIKNNSPKHDLIGSPRTIIDKWTEEKRNAGLNGGQYFSVKFMIRGDFVDLDDLKLFVGMEEERKLDLRRSRY